MDLDRLARALRLVLRQSGRIALALQGNVAREEKEKDSPYQTSTAVTVVDRLAQELVLLAALDLEPSLGVESEEADALPPALSERASRNRGERLALALDPLDGTDEYLRGGEAWAHMAGVLDREEGRLELALVCFPARDLLYEAARGKGARVARGLSEPAPLATRPAPPRTVGEVKRLLASDREAFARAGLVPDATLDRSAADTLVAVAEGRLGVSVLRQFRGHDTAIPGLLVEEAGGAVLSEDGRPPRYEAGLPRLPLVVASGSPALAREVLGLATR